MNFLLEFGQSTRARGKDLLQFVEGELKKIDPGIKLVINVNKQYEKPEKPIFLQRFSSNWKQFVDVMDVTEIENGDRLKAVPLRQSSNSGDSIVKKTQSIIERIKKPSEMEVKSLFKRFPSGSGSRKRKFDPNEECVATPSHSKKKAFKKKPKMTSVTVVVLKKFQPMLPNGKERRELSAEGRIQKINLHREMTSLEVKSVIKEAFKSALKHNSFAVLENEGGAKLVRASYQEIGGIEAVDRRGALYLVETKEAYNEEDTSSKDDSDSDDFLSPETQALFKQADKVLEDLKKPTESRNIIDLTDQDQDHVLSQDVTEDINDSSEAEEPSRAQDRTIQPSQERTIQPSQESVNEIQVPEPNRTTVPSRTESLQEYREIRAQQDAEFEESLRIDRQKVLDKERVEAEKFQRDELRQALKDRWNVDKLFHEGGLKFSICLPDRSTVQCSLPSTMNCKALYEIAFAYGNFNENFRLFSKYPRLAIPHSIVLSELQVVPPAALIVEISDSESVDFLFDSMASTSSDGSVDIASGREDLEFLSKSV